MFTLADRPFFMFLLIHVAHFLYAIYIYLVHMLNHVNTMPCCTDLEHGMIRIFWYDFPIGWITFFMITSSVFIIKLTEKLNEKDQMIWHPGVRRNNRQNNFSDK